MNDRFSTIAGWVLFAGIVTLGSSIVSGLYFNHPQADYFGLGKVSRAQVADYAQRKQMPVAEVERWLGPVLAYDA